MDFELADCGIDFDDESTPLYKSIRHSWCAPAREQINKISYTEDSYHVIPLEGESLPTAEVFLCSLLEHGWEISGIGDGLQFKELEYKPSADSFSFKQEDSLTESEKTYKTSLLKKGYIEEIDSSREDQPNIIRLYPNVTTGEIDVESLAEDLLGIGYAITGLSNQAITFTELYKTISNESRFSLENSDPNRSVLPGPCERCQEREYEYSAVPSDSKEGAISLCSTCISEDQELTRLDQEI